MRTDCGRTSIFDLFAATARLVTLSCPRSLLRMASHTSLLRTWCTGVAIARVLGRLLALICFFDGGGG